MELLKSSVKECPKKYYPYKHIDKTYRKYYNLVYKRIARDQKE